MENILTFIRPELFILVIFLYCIGLFLKLWKCFSKEWMIPYILLGVSFLSTLCYVTVYEGETISGQLIVAVAIQSVLIAATAVFGNELIKQFTVKRKSE